MSDHYNVLFPARPSYLGPGKGHFGLLHHEVLFEPSHDVKERVDYVRRAKPYQEVTIRLHNMIYLGDDLCKKIDTFFETHPQGRENYNRFGFYNNIKEHYSSKETEKIEILREEILVYIFKHIPDCVWMKAANYMRFPDISTP